MAVRPIATRGIRKRSLIFSLVFGKNVLETFKNGRAHVILEEINPVSKNKIF
jgi:hypothetical protein